jgi:hypothetical protein
MSNITVKFKKVGSFGIADAIMSLLSSGERLLDLKGCDGYIVDHGIELYADAWDNCREQGYRLNGDVMGRRFSICFGEHRNVDTPTIWHSEGCRWPDDGNWTNESPGTVDAAAEKIVDLVEFYVNKYNSERGIRTELVGRRAAILKQKAK